MDSNNALPFIRENIQHLKREYGLRLHLGNQVILEQSITTGIKKTTYVSKNITRAIRLPNQVSFRFIKSLIGSTKGLEALAGLFQIIIDKGDLKGWDQEIVVGKTYAIYDGKRVDIKGVEDLPYAVILQVVQIKGAILPQTDFSDSITLGQILETIP